MQEISFTVDGQKLVGTIQYPATKKEKNPAVLLIHGWMSSQRGNIRYAQELNKLGYVCMTFDLRGHGQSDGTRSVLSREDYMKDVVAAFDLLKSQEGVDSENISVVGSSFGSYLAALVTEKRDVKSLVLRVPANYPDNGFDEPQVKFANSKTTAWRKEKLSYNGTVSLRAVHKFQRKVLMVESELDLLCPHQTILNYLHAVSDPDNVSHKVIKGADHSLRTEKFRTEFKNILVDWFGNAILNT